MIRYPCGIVFSREVWIDASVLSDAPEGVTDDNLPADQDRLAVISAETGDIVLRLQRVELESGVHVWKIAGSTVARTAELYAEFGYGRVLALLVANAVLYELGLGITARGLAAGHTVPILAVTWLILATLNVARDGLVASLHAQHRDAAVVIQRPIFGAIKIVVIVTAALTWLDNVGYNVTTLLASLGVGGIAMALALQKPLEDAPRRAGLGRSVRELRRGRLSPQAASSVVGPSFVTEYSSA